MADKFDLMDQNTDTKNLKKEKKNEVMPYAFYRETEEWAIMEKLLNKLVENQDIELKTAPEYVIGYLVRELRNKDLTLMENFNSPPKRKEKFIK